VGVIKGILIHQGCTDNTQPDWPDRVNLVYTRLLKELGLNAEDVPLLIGELMHKENGGICHAHNEVIARTPQVIPTAHVVSSAGCPGAPDGLHFTAEGYRMLGRNYAGVMLKLLKK
jgi:alpha-L-fucosidase 2